MQFILVKKVFGTNKYQCVILALISINVIDNIPLTIVVNKTPCNLSSPTNFLL